MAKDILKGLALGGLIVSSFALPNLPQIFHLFGVDGSKDRFKVRRSINKLQKKKLVVIYEKDGMDVVEITKEGEKKILKYKLEEIKILRPKKWDGDWRLIILDIPENFTNASNAHSTKHSDMEIYPLQKSVFVCPFSCRDEIDFIGEFFNVRKYIYYIEADKVEKDNALRDFYNI